MSQEQRRPRSANPDAPPRKKSSAAFWRACRYLFPYRKIVATSIFCALLVGVAFAGGLGTMLPIMRVLVEGDTLKGWADREVAERRLGATFIDRPVAEVRGIQVITLRPKGALAKAGVKEGDEIFAGPARATVADHLSALADPPLTSLPITTANGAAVTLALPAVSWYLAAVGNVAGQLPTDPVWAIAAVFALIATIAIVSNVLKFFQEYCSDKAAILAVNDIRRQLYDRVLHVPMSQFGARGTSDITSRLVQDAQQMEIGFKTVLGQTIQEPIKAATAFGLALFVSWKLTLFIVVFAPLMLAIIKKFGKKMRRASRSALQSSAVMLGQIEGTLSGIRVVKAASAERFERRRYVAIMRKLINEQLRMSRLDAFSGPTMETLTLIVFGAIILIASHMVLKTRSLETTSFFLVLACLVGIADSLRRVSKVNNVLQRANAGAERVFEVMDLPIEGEREVGRHEGTKGEARHERTTGRRHEGEDGKKGAADHPQVLDGRDPALRASELHASGLRASYRKKLPGVAREIRFEDVTFSYGAARNPALVEVSLEVPKGQCVAIVGRNGSGKTTLLAMLPRFYDPQKGRVSIDGIDVRDLSLRSLRNQISIVTQDSVIFPGTIAQNIAYGRPLATREQIEAAARRAFAHEFILEKPGAYDTMLGEMGGQLSGGQKQRLCIARAILRQAPILILDEATSQVDAESEHLIQQAIDGLLREAHDAPGVVKATPDAAGNGTALSAALSSPTASTTLTTSTTTTTTPTTPLPFAAPTLFVIAHRFSTIKSADTIVVMDKGRIVGQGRHDELTQTCETYQQLYERQLFTPTTMRSA